MHCCTVGVSTVSVCVLYAPPPLSVPWNLRNAGLSCPFEVSLLSRSPWPSTGPVGGSEAPDSINFLPRQGHYYQKEHRPPSPTEAPPPTTPFSHFVHCKVRLLLLLQSHSSFVSAPLIRKTSMCTHCKDFTSYTSGT